MKHVLLLAFLVATFPVFAQSKDEMAVRNLMAKQSKAWNEGNIDAFMNGYWKNDSLMFVGKSGVTYGYDATLKNYKKGYPDKAAMGELTFTLIKVKKLSKNYQFVVGKWYLKRSIGDVSGHFNLLFQKISGEWVIVVDHSS
jgi:ketosteroid isomerase-like protein